MKSLTLSMNGVLSLIIGFMGLLGLILTLASGTIHENHAFENQRISLQRQIGIKVVDLLVDLADVERKLGLALQKEKAFRDAYSSGDRDAMHAILANEFHRYFTTTGKISLEKISVFSADFTLVSELAEESSTLGIAETGCDHLVSGARPRSGAERLQMLSDLCVYKNRPYHATLLPIGGLRLVGYVLVTTDPTHNLIEIQDALGMPLALRYPDGSVAYQAERWPTEISGTETVTAEHVLRTSSNVPVLSVVVADQVRPLFHNITNTSIPVMISACLITIIVIFIAILVLKKTTINPLRRLTHQLQRLRTDRSSFGETIKVEGIREIRRLGNDFNAMTSDLERLYKSLEDMAFTDEVTQLPNRNQFQKHLQEMIEECSEPSRPFAMFMMDLNRFKAINDTLGHDVGDRLLREVGLRLGGVLNSEGGGEECVGAQAAPLARNYVLARLGGDEFAVILKMRTGSNFLKDASAAAQEFLAAMEDPFDVDGHKLAIGVSIGGVLFPIHGNDRNDLMRKADVAMYNAKIKSSGFAFYDSQHDKYSVRYLTLGRDLQKAVQHNQLELWYQPKVDIGTGRVCGAEALIRWHHPVLGLVPPDEFIPIAEQSGQIKSMTNWIIDQALEQYSAWKRAGHQLAVSINLSTVNLHDERMPATIDAAISRFSADPQEIVLELTESAIMDDPEHALAVLNKLRQRKLKLSIDDFGTGYSSLAYIKRLPVDEIKIDRSFVRDICSDSNDEAIIRSVVVLSRHMGIRVVAEGVEDSSSYYRLQELGCDVVQGYHIARPMPFREFMEWLDTTNWNATATGRVDTA